MKVVDAFWEKRNLGVTCTELTLDERDGVEEVAATLDGLKTAYQVVKVPAGRYDMMVAVEKLGFSFIEGSLNVVHHLNQVEPVGILKRLNDAVTYGEMNQSDMDKLYVEIKNGLFVTDRIYMDTFFTPLQAAQRYVFWLGDEINKGAQLYKACYKDKSVGFFVFKETTAQSCYPFLTGLYSAATTPGLGGIVIKKIIAEAIRRKLRTIDTYVSSNNVAVIKVLISEGFSIFNINYVYIKHHRIIS
jgi:hypothetical protein